jgi:hypothetical protein
MSGNPPDSPVRLEAAAHLLDRAAHQQFVQFLEALDAEYEHAVRMMLNADSEMVRVAQGAAVAIHNLCARLRNAERSLIEYQRRLDAHTRANSQTETIQ